MRGLAPIRILLGVLGLLFAISVQAQIAFRSDTSAGIASGTPVFVDDATSTANASSLSINRPATTTEGNLLLAHIAVRGATTTITPPSGWTLVSSTSSAADLTQSIYWRLATAAEPASYTWTFSSSHRAAGGIQHFRDVNIANPIDAAGGQVGSGTNITAPSQNQTANNSLLVALYASAYAAANNHSTPTGMTEQYDLSSAGGGGGVTVSANTRLDATAGATGDKISTSGNSAENVGHLVVLRPAGQNLTIAVPAGTAADDVMIASVTSRPSGTTIATPAGWTLVRSTTQPNDVTMRLYTFRRVATASEPVAYTWVLGGTTTTGAVGGIASFSGVDVINPINVEGGNTTTNASWTHRANQVTTTIANTMLVSTHAFTSATQGWTPPAGMTEMVDAASEARPSVDGMGMEMNYVAQAAAGATGNKDAVADGTGTDLGYGAAHLLALRPVSGPHHIELLHGTGSGLTCAASMLTIRACADAACSTLYTGGVSGTLTGTGINWDGTTGGAAGAGFAIASGSSSVTKNFQPGAAGAVVLGTTSLTPTASSATTCNFGSPSCTFTADTAGFIFSATTTGSAATIPAQVSGTATGTYYLRAVQASTTNAAVCTPAIISQSGVAVTMGYNCVDPASCQAGNLLTVNSTAVPAAGGSVSLNFDANGSAPVTLRYDDVGSIAVTASKTITPFSGATAVTLNGSSNTYVVKPDHFDLSAIECGATVNPAAADATGALFCKAGANFSVTVTARNALGGATPNYGKETTAEGVRLTSALAGGIGLSVDPGISNATAFGSFSGGVATGSTFAWNETGIITLTPGVGDSDYLGAGDVSGTASGNVGRFYPDHFDLTAAMLTPAGGTFSYLNQPFGASFTLAAKAAGGGTTQNYVSSATPANNFAKLDPANAALWPSTTLGTTGFALGAKNNATELSSRLATTATPTGSWAAGIANIAASLMLARGAAPDGPFDVLDIGVAPRDSDGVTLQAAALDMDANNDSSNERVRLGQTQARFGRLRLVNFYGSEVLAPRVEYRAEYWAGSRWATNTLDGTTAFAAANIAPGGLTVNGVGAINAGIGFITFNMAAAGSYDIAVNLNASGSDTSCNATHGGTAGNKLWLQGYWGAPASCGGVAAWVQDPNARVRLGTSKTPLIYRRELY